MNLPPIPDDELDLARAYVDSILSDAQEPSLESVHLIVARYGILRSKNVTFLRELAGKQATREIPQDSLAWRQYRSDLCPVCSAKKRPAKDWFDRECWAKLPRDLQVRLRFGFRAIDVPQYLRAMNFLKQEARV